MNLRAIVQDEGLRDLAAGTATGYARAMGAALEAKQAELRHEVEQRGRRPAPGDLLSDGVEAKLGQLKLLAWILALPATAREELLNEKTPKEASDA